MPRKTNLFTWRANGEEATARLLLALETFYQLKIFHVPEQKSVRVRSPYNSTFPEISGVEFNLCDNGGEINVEPINNPDQLSKSFPVGLRSIPYTSTDRNITAEVMAYRIYFAMTAREIDWSDVDMPPAGNHEETLRLINP